MKYYIVDEDKDKDIQIGIPTDVKHVAHIGWDGPSSSSLDNSPSWVRIYMFCNINYMPYILHKYDI